MRDLLGVACSGLCIIHCLALPLALAVGLPIAGLSMMTEESVHVVLITLIVALAVWAFPAGWRRHKRLLPLGIAGCGIALMLATTVAPQKLEVSLAVIAGVTLIAAHLSNRLLLIKPESVASGKSDSI